MKLVDLFFAYSVYPPIRFHASLDFNDEYLVEGSRCLRPQNEQEI